MAAANVANTNPSVNMPPPVVAVSRRGRDRAFGVSSLITALISIDRSVHYRRWGFPGGNLNHPSL
jgi:hypothetical protein